MKKILFFDIETVVSPTTDGENLKGMIEEDIENREKYGDRYNFMPEFNEIICLCACEILVNGIDSTIQEHKLSINKFSEAEIIKKFYDLVCQNNNLCGYNIKFFDLHFIIKRGLYYGIRVPAQLKFFGKKPWELEHIIDLYEVYKMNSNSCSLDLLCKQLLIPTPKDKMNGSEVKKYFFEGKIDDIVEYCMKDVYATWEVYKKFISLNVM